jgi:hypothetical protein
MFHAVCLQELGSRTSEVPSHSHLVLQHVALEGFGPFRNPVSYPLADRGVVAVTGRNEDDAAAVSNGAGKTSLLTALLWAFKVRRLGGCGHGVGDGGPYAVMYEGIVGVATARPACSLRCCGCSRCAVWGEADVVLIMAAHMCSNMCWTLTHVLLEQASHAQNASLGFQQVALCGFSSTAHLKCSCVLCRVSAGA